MTTATQRQLRKGTTSQIAAKTPVSGEMWADTSLPGRVVIGDGTTAGGKNMNYNSSGLIDAPKGVQFPATVVASADPNALDDYEEGTFTPALQFGGATTGITYTSQAGAYTKIGNTVTFNLKFVLSSKGTATGTATLGGLPFGMVSAPASNAAAFNIVASAMNASLASPLSGYVNSGNTTMALVKFAAGNITNLADTDFANTSQMWISGHYKTS